jgi:hypothetical protein
VTEKNPFTNPRDANLAAAWEYGSKIGKRRERILIALCFMVAAVLASYMIFGWVYHRDEMYPCRYDSPPGVCWNAEQHGYIGGPG